MDLILVGATRGHLGQSLWLREIAGREDGPPPPVDLAEERRNGNFVRAQILGGHVLACHDVSDGGVLIAVVEMALAGDIGVDLVPRREAVPPHAFWFGEDQARYIVAVRDAPLFLLNGFAAGVPTTLLGRTGIHHLTLPGGATISLEALRRAHERFLPAWMDGTG
jgi:phosphoribosylformylglycinamidine synthase